MRGRRCARGWWAAAFGVGLLLALCLPAKALVVLLAAVVAVCGVFLALR